MKKGLVLCFFIAGGLVLATSSFETRSFNRVAERVALKITEQLIHKIETQIELRQSLSNVNLMAPIIPDVDDPACLNPINIPDINLPIPDLFNITGSLGFGIATVTGLSKITDDANLNPVVGNVTATWLMELPTVSIETTYDMDLILELVSVHSIVGLGNLEASVDNVFFNLTAKGLIPVVLTNKLRLFSLDVDLGFSNLKLTADEATIDGDTIIDWQQAATNLETYFHSIWNDEVRGIVNEAVRCSIDHVVNTCTSGDIIGQKFDCLTFEINPSCFEDVEINEDEKFQISRYFRAGDTCSSDTTTNEPTDKPGPTGPTEEPGTDEPQPTGDTNTSEATEGTESPGGKGATLKSFSAAIVVFSGICLLNM